MIPFNKPYITGHEIKYMEDAIARNKLSGDGFYTKKANQFIEETFGTKKALLTTSCTSALDMAAILLELQPGDEVILPSFTFVSTVNPIVLRGAKPVFAEICEDTLNIDPEDIRKRLTKQTKAIIPVHYAGVGCDMDAILAIAQEYDLKIVEDAAQGVNAKYKGKFLGTFGDLGAYSFHDTKNYSCGEGGAILINYDENMAKRAELIREKGTNRSQFIRGEVDKYTWVDMGSSLLPSELLAAFLTAQFEQLEEINLKRKRIYDFYQQNLAPLAERGLLRLPIIPADCEINYHMFYILLNSEEERNYLMDELKKRGVSAVFHYLPLHTSPMGLSLGNHVGDLPITESISARLLRLPMYADLTKEQQQFVVENIFDILKVTSLV